MGRTLRFSAALGLCAITVAPHAVMAQDAAGDEYVIVLREPKIAPYSVNQSTIFCGPYTWTVQWTTEMWPSLVVKGRVTVNAGDKVHQFSNAQTDEVFSKVRAMSHPEATCDFRNGMAYSQLLIGSETEDGEGDVVKLHLPEGFAVAAPAPSN